MLEGFVGACCTAVSSCACTGINILERLSECCTSTAAWLRAEPVPGIHTDEHAAIPALRTFDTSSAYEPWKDQIAIIFREVMEKCVPMRRRSPEEVTLKGQVFNAMRELIKDQPRNIQLAFIRYLRDDCLPRFEEAGSEEEAGRRGLASTILYDVLSQLENTAHKDFEADTAVGDLTKALKAISSKITSARYCASTCCGRPCACDPTARVLAPKSMVVDYIIKIAKKFEPTSTNATIFEIIAFGLMAVRIDGKLTLGMSLKDFLEGHASGKWKELVTLINSALRRLPAEAEFLKGLSLQQFIANGEQDNAYHKELLKKIREMRTRRGTRTLLGVIGITLTTIVGLYAWDRAHPKLGPTPIVPPVYPIGVDWDMTVSNLGQANGIYYYNATGTWAANTTLSGGIFGYIVAAPSVYQCEGHGSGLPCQRIIGNGTNTGSMSAILYSLTPGPFADYLISASLTSGDGRTVVMRPPSISRPLPAPPRLAIEDKKEGASAAVTTITLTRKHPRFRGAALTTPFHDEIKVTTPAATTELALG